MAALIKLSNNSVAPSTRPARMAQSMPFAKTSKRGAYAVSFPARTWSDIATARYKSCASAKRLNDISLSASLTTRLEIILGMVD